MIPGMGERSVWVGMPTGRNPAGGSPQGLHRALWLYVAVMTVRVTAAMASNVAEDAANDRSKLGICPWSRLDCRNLRPSQVPIRTQRSHLTCPVWMIVQ